MSEIAACSSAAARRLILAVGLWSLKIKCTQGISGSRKVPMPDPLRLKLTDKQRAELEQARDHHPKPYVRERAAALLKIAAGQTAGQVARQGLLKERRSEEHTSELLSLRHLVCRLLL